MLANIPWSGFGITGLADPINPQDGATKNYVDGLISPPGIGGLIFGLTLSNDGSLPNTTIDIASGAAASSDQTTVMTSGAFAKTTAAFATGTGNGGLDAGSVAASTWYHVYIIEGVGGTDFLISHSATAPTMPTGFTKSRRIGAFKTDGSSHIIAFTQNGNEFLWGTAVQDITTTTLGTVATLFTLNVPLGVKVNALMRGSATVASSTSAVLINSPDQAAVASSLTNATVIATAQNFSFGANVRTDTSSRVRAVANAASTTLGSTTYGWIDTRGENS